MASDGNIITGTTVKVEIVGGPKVSVPCSAGMNAQTALERAYALINSTASFTYALQYYGPTLGYLVSMINETYDTFPNAGSTAAQPYFYWDFLVNGNSSMTGIDETPLNAGDTIRFRFDAYDPAVHIASTLEVKHIAQTQGQQPGT